MSRPFTHALIVGCTILSVQAIVGRLNAIGAFFAAWPVTWGVWLYLAWLLIHEGRWHLRYTSNPITTVMTWSGLAGAVTGFIGAVVEVILALLLAGGSTRGAESTLQALFLFPLSGLFVCGSIGLVMGILTARHQPQIGR